MTRWLTDTFPHRDGTLAALTWANTPFDHGRASIFKALRIDATDRTALFATAPFRVIQDDGLNYIAGAIGCPPHLDVDGLKTWSTDEVRDVILWNPRLGSVRVMGEAASQPTLTLPDDRTTVTIYAGAFAFFRDWAERRAAHWIRSISVQPWQRAVTEPADSLIPGALAIGDLTKLNLGQIDAVTLMAGPGVDAETLRTAVWRSARMPHVPAPLRRAA